MDILREIEERVGREDREPNILYGEIKQLGLFMVYRNQLSHADVVAMCADLIAMYEKLNAANKR